MWPVKIWWRRYQHYYWAILMAFNGAWGMRLPMTGLNVMSLVCFVLCLVYFVRTMRAVWDFDPIYHRLVKAFGSKDAANRWLCEPNMWLKGAKPLEVMQDEDGRDVIAKYLDGIENGVLA